jgi:hypothetical protein
MEERRLSNGHGTTITFEYVEKWGNYLMRSTFEDGGMHFMFIKDIEQEVVMLKGEGYGEIKDSTNI